MTEHKRIFIIGHPGAGKALLARTLANQLGWQFIDADLGLEFHIGRTLPNIIGKQGEAAYYNSLSEILMTQLVQENIVVTTDASIVCNEKNRQLLSSEFIVYLKVSTPVQLERTARNPTPLLSTTDFSNFLDELHLERDNLYEKVSSFTINGDDSALENHVLSIQKCILDADGLKHAIKQLPLTKEDLVFFHKTDHGLVHLSEQQAMSLKLLAQGKTAKEIAKEMNISYRTVEDYIAKTMELLGCVSSKELIALYHGKS